MSRRILVRVYGDSLSLPRAGDGLDYADTYPELLSAECRKRWPDAQVHLYNRSDGGSTVGELSNQCRKDNFCFGDTGGAILVIQSGVVDCAPRPIPDLVRRVISVLPGPLRRPIIRFLHNNRARLLRAGFVFRKTKPGAFASQYRQWLEIVAPQFEQVYVLNIAPTTAAMEAHSPGFTASIERYNALIARAIAEVGAANVVLVDAHAAISEAERGLEQYLNAEDGHHLTVAGQRLYFALIAAALGSTRVGVDAAE